MILVVAVHGIWSVGWPSVRLEAGLPWLNGHTICSSQTACVVQRCLQIVLTHPLLSTRYQTILKFSPELAQSWWRKKIIRRSLTCLLFQSLWCRDRQVLLEIAYNPSQHLLWLQKQNLSHRYKTVEITRLRKLKTRIDHWPASQYTTSGLQRPREGSCLGEFRFQRGR